MRKVKIILATDINGCITPTSHKLNQDGYFRVTDSRVQTKGRRPKVMYHRLVWEETYGEIPDGFEIDHKCRNRACCNLEHLQMLEGTEHTIKTNRERYSERHQEAKAYWESTGCTGTKLAEVFNVSFGIGCKWIRNWKKGVETKCES